MKVSIAAQTLSVTVGLKIKRKGHEEFGNFILMMDRWFDMMNTSFYHLQRRGKPDMKTFEANDCFSNKRLIWLKNIFIPYFETWNKSVFQSYEALTKAERRALLLSKATSNVLLMITKADLIEDCFN